MVIMTILQLRAVEDIRKGDEVTTRYGGLNIGQVLSLTSSHLIIYDWPVHTADYQNQISGW